MLPSAGEVGGGFASISRPECIGRHRQAVVGADFHVLLGHAEDRIQSTLEIGVVLRDTAAWEPPVDMAGRDGSAGPSLGDDPILGESMFAAIDLIRLEPLNKASPMIGSPGARTPHGTTENRSNTTTIRRARGPRHRRRKAQTARDTETDYLRAAWNRVKANPIRRGGHRAAASTSGDSTWGST